ncbi:hypothetical protein BTA51_26320 [Hahella sp. CCB-MM4]|uniref:hypothetical protein n=1 Tax=Hahella sp. (strain CCB-MM4) TaxID=1926491 RepID=UPI000B9B5AAE|nr:hypothetical protein [Hahella sp. CCB-MM4]OZG70360.1 hypothetical protein BTA51_26320 [Hahella sp. CCB-MM4]
MPTYIFLPVPNDEMLGNAEDWVEGFKKIGGDVTILINKDSHGLNRKGLRHLFGLGALRQLTTADTLYVMAHGRSERHHYNGIKLIGARRGDVWKNYTPEHLASTLYKEGLRTDFVDLRLFCCNSGVARDDDGRCYAQDLCDAMRDRYPGIQVTGYEGTLYSNYGPRFRKSDFSNRGNSDSAIRVVDRGIEPALYARDYSLMGRRGRASDFKVVYAANEI